MRIALYVSYGAKFLLGAMCLIWPALSVGQFIVRDIESDVVGSSFGEFSVSQTGAASYHLPLYAAPGTAGVTPQLAIAYSSHGTYGPLGQGFALTGQSAITRCRATIESGDFVAGADIDGDGVGIQFDQNDRFCLDGQRLMVVSGAYGAPDSNYRTELDQLLLVTARGGTVDNPVTIENEYTGPSYFEVRRKDGSLSHYGNTPNSRIERNGCLAFDLFCAQRAFAYALNRMMDSSGNYIDYAYQELADSEFNLLSVNYTGKVNLPGQAGPTLSPYARLRMIYATAPVAERTLAFLGGSRMAQTQRLDAIVLEDEAGFARMLRYYRLLYQTSVSGSNLRQLQALQECRDATLTVCYPPTTFTWSNAINQYVTQEAQNFPLPPGISGELQIKDSRIGDIDGDSRPDFAYWREDAACPGGQLRLFVNFADRTEIAGQSWATLVSPSQGVICTKLSAGDGELATGWALIDFNADGREDLAIADDESQVSPRWRVYPSIGRPVAAQSIFNTSSDMANLAITSASDAFNQAQFGDFNGDGVLDLLTGDLVLHFTERHPDGDGLQFTPAFPISLTFLPSDPCANPEANNIVCVVTLGNEFTGRGFNAAPDLSGDGRADIQVRILRQQASRMHPWRGQGSIVVSTPTALSSYWADPENRGSGTLHWYLMAMDRRLGANASTDCEDAANPDPNTQCVRQLQDATAANSDTFFADARRFADVNGDGLPDVIEPTGNNREFRVHLTTGSPQASAVPILVSGIDAAMQVLDIDGDGRADLVYPEQSAGKSHYLKRSWRPTGGSGSFTSATLIPGDGIDPCDVADCNLADINDLFVDIDADGALDYLRYRNRLGANSLLISRAENGHRYRPRDAVERITNGYGAITEIRYWPLTNKEVYRRDRGSILDADLFSPNGPTRFGRGSPVIDVLAPMYVVAKVESSSPMRNNLGATTSVHYRYAGAKMQSGGRGFLGFRELTTFDGNGIESTGYVIAATEYRQDFPFVGNPARTTKWVAIGSYVPAVCRTNMEAIGFNCFPTAAGDFPPIVDPLAHVAVRVYESEPDFVPSLPSVPIHARWLGSDEYTVDFTSGVFTSRVLSAWIYDEDGSGDVVTTGSETRAAPFDRAPLVSSSDLANWVTDTESQVERLRGLLSCVSPCIKLEVTDNDYFAKDFVNWRLGRLQTSSVTVRNEVGDVRSRLSDFTYDLTSTAKTGLLTSERVQKAVDGRQDLRTLYQLDAFGNRTAAYTCSNDLSDASCLDRLQVAMRPINGNGTPSERVHRYVRTTMDNRGRYVTATNAPFFNGAVGNGVTDQPTFLVISRDEHGQITQQLDTNGRASGATTGWLGRPLQTWMQTVDNTSQYTESITRLRWCQGTPQPGSKVACPPGAVFRSKTTSTGSAASYTYFDVLGREILKVGESFNQGVFGKDFHASCIGYDRHGRVPFASEPFFLTTAAVSGEPDFAGGTYAPCADNQLTGTRTAFDPIGRAVFVQAPEDSPGNQTSTMIAYNGLSTITTTTYMRDTNDDGMGELRQTVQSETKNAAGELVLTVDPHNVATRFQYNPDGQVTFVCRNAINPQSLSTVCPDNSANQIVTSSQYDALGRKVSETDPDLGTMSYTYNAANELIRMDDALGNRVESHYDAQGRVWRRVSNAPSPIPCAVGSIFCDGFEGGQLNLATAVVDTFEFDTDANGLGLPAMMERQQPGQPVYRKTMDYDLIGRPLAQHTELDGSTYSETTSYDALGRVAAQTDVSGETLTAHHNARGFVEFTTYSLGAVELTRTLETNARGQVVRERRGGQAGMEVHRQFDLRNGQLNRICAGINCAIQEWDFTWDALDTLVARERYRTMNPAKNHREVFIYDEQHRLTESRLRRVAGVVPGGGFATVFTASYDALGNICSKNGNTYRYGPKSGCANNFASGSPHAVRQAFGKTLSYDANGDLTLSDGSSSDRRVVYDAQRQAVEIEVTGGNAHLTRFRYGPELGRYKRIDTDIGGTTTIRYLGNVEQITLPSGVVETKRYLAGVAIFTTRSNAPAIIEQRYTFGDQLGSVETITNETGTVIETINFDAHGNRRDTSDWQGPGTSAATTTRGFTGHEHIDGVALIHMNARLYDPELGRFLQADVVVEAPTSLQSWNRFTYVFNNPLSLTDPTGRMSSRDWEGIAKGLFLIFSGTAIGGVATGLGASGVTAAVTTGVITGYLASGGSAKGAAYGAFSALLFFGIGEVFHKGAPSEGAAGTESAEITAAKIIAHGIAGGATQSLQGGKFGHGFATAIVTQSLSGQIDRIGASDTAFSAARVAVAALVGGTVSKLTGGKFSNGALTAAYSRAFNDDAHRRANNRSAEMYRGGRSGRVGAYKPGDKIRGRSLDWVARYAIRYIYATYPDAGEREYGGWIWEVDGGYAFGDITVGAPKSEVTEGFAGEVSIRPIQDGDVAWFHNHIRSPVMWSPGDLVGTDEYGRLSGREITAYSGIIRGGKEVYHYWRSGSGLDNPSTELRF